MMAMWWLACCTLLYLPGFWVVNSIMLAMVFGKGVGGSNADIAHGIEQTAMVEYNYRSYKTQ